MRVILKAIKYKVLKICLLHSVMPLHGSWQLVANGGAKQHSVEFTTAMSPRSLRFKSFALASLSPC